MTTGSTTGDNGSGFWAEGSASAGVETDGGDVGGGSRF